MKIAFLEVTLRIPWAHSLKEKRSEVKRLLAKLRNRFHVSAAEAAAQDDIQTAVLAIAILAANSAQGDSMLETLLRFIEDNTQAQLLHAQREYR